MTLAGISLRTSVVVSFGQEVEQIDSSSPPDLHPKINDEKRKRVMISFLNR